MGLFKFGYSATKHEVNDGREVAGADGKLNKLYICQRHLHSGSISKCDHKDDWVEAIFPVTVTTFPGAFEP